MSHEERRLTSGKYVLPFSAVDQFRVAEVGGKGANLGELVKAGFSVPAGFCVIVLAYGEFIENSAEIGQLYEELDQVDVEDLAAVQILGGRIRSHLLSLAIPEDIEAQVLNAWQETGVELAYAVRSSATAEDLPTASFAGQQDTYLNVIGQADLLNAIRACWASLFTDRAIIYRAKNGFDYRKTALAVVVQRMVMADVAGTMFTADPVSGNRRLISIDASFGLGEALVSGLVSPDFYQVKQGKLVKKQIARKELAIYAKNTSGTVQQALSLERQTSAALSDQEVIALARLGEQIQEHYGSPQDIEWVLAGGEFYIVQSRPITSLYPFPDDLLKRKLDVLISFGHPQMMTEAIRPLGVSVLRTLLPVGKEGPDWTEGDALLEAGGRLYINYSPLLRFKKVREKAPAAFRGIDAQIGMALEVLIKQRPDLQTAKATRQNKKIALRYLVPVVVNVFLDLFFRDPTKALARTNRLIEELMQETETKLLQTAGVARIRLIQENTGSLMMPLLRSMAHYFYCGMLASGLISKLAQKWLGDNAQMPALNKSLAGNVTTEMGLQLGDLADLARSQPQLVKYLEEAQDKEAQARDFQAAESQAAENQATERQAERFYAGLQEIEGAAPFREALAQFLGKYGMRCPGEIDLTRPRWRDRPTEMLTIILGNVYNLQSGEHRVKFVEGEREAKQAAERLLKRLRQTRGGWAKARLVARFIKVYRHLMGIREHPKYAISRHFGLYQQTLLDEGKLLVAKGVLSEAEDVFYLSLAEVIAVLEQSFVGNVQELISRRREEYIYDQKLTPPRVMTGEGEIVKGTLRLDQAPVGALIGNPVSAGVVEGRARVVLKLGEARLEKGDILVTAFTDPGWTPLFLMIGGLITETGGLMTHGAVVAREYGIPAVVGIENATKVIKDGQRVRLNGDQGYVEIM